MRAQYAGFNPKAAELLRRDEGAQWVEGGDWIGCNNCIATAALSLHPSKG